MALPAFTLVPETGEGLADANSYASVADLDAILAANLYADIWNSASNDIKGRIASMGTKLIDSDCLFRGWRKSETQGLDWPRIRARNFDTYGQMPGQLSALYAGYYDDSSIPQILKEAEGQVVLDILNSAGKRLLENPTKGIRSIGVGQSALNLVFDQTTQIKPLSEAARRMLSKLGTFRYGMGFVRLRRTG